MEVELVKVKINKLKEVKKQLRKKKGRTKKNLKNLLLDNEEKNRKDDIIYQSINAIFQGEENNETVDSTRYLDSMTSDYHIDLEDLLESLDVCQNNLLIESPSESLSIQESNILTEEKNEESINLIADNQSMNSISLANEDNSSENHQGGEMYLCGDISPESILICNNSILNLETNTNTNITNLEPDMVELGNYYIPDTVFETINDHSILMDDFCNEIEIAMTEDQNTEDFNNQSEIEDPIIPNLNNNHLEEETNNLTENEVILNAIRGVAVVNPLLVTIPEADIQTMALYQLQQKNDSNEINNLGETEILKNYSWEQKANLIAAAKMLYTKRTRVLLHWLDPNLSSTKMRATLELSWQNLPLWQKEVYISQDGKAVKKCFCMDEEKDQGYKSSTECHEEAVQ